MTQVNLSEKAERYLHHLCVEIANRRVGSEGNRASTDFFADTVDAFGFQVECPSFECLDWRQEGALLRVDGIAFASSVSPYTLGCDVCAPLVAATTFEELETAEITNKVLLMRGDIAKEQIMPKNFPFYNPDHHGRIIRLLESRQPQAIVAATTQDVGLAGAISPFPLFEDGDFDIPSVYMTADEGEKLSSFVGREASLTIRARRSASTGCNVIARKGTDQNRRVVLFAHIDAKDGTPGAIDNGTGVVILLLLAELLANYVGRLSIEIVALNGEDYYAASGEKLYVRTNDDKFHEIVLGINSDGVGYREGRTAYSLYDCPPDIENLVRRSFAARRGMVEGEQWYQSDHSLFTLHQRPALALTSDRFTELWTEIAHTPKDTPEIVDATKLVEVAGALLALFYGLDKLISATS